MSCEHINTHPSVDKTEIPTVHHEAFVRHAVRGIKGADKLCDQVFNKATQFSKERLHEEIDVSHNLYRHRWS